MKLNLTDFLQWIESEQSGYKNRDHRELPSYRIVSGETKAFNPYHGWQPVVFHHAPSAKLLSERGVNQPIGQLEEVLRGQKDSILTINFGPEAKKSIMEALGIDLDVRFIISPSSVKGILDAVRDKVLDWSLKLEQMGITGEGMSFSETEKQKANVASTVYHIANVGMIGNASDNAKIEVDQRVGFNIEDIKVLINEINKNIEAVPLDGANKTKVTEALNEVCSVLPELVNMPANKAKLIKPFTSMKNIFENITGNVVAAGIVQMITKLMTGQL